MPNYNEIISRKNYIFLPPEITGVAKHNWLSSQMKKPHSLQESSFQPWGVQGLWSTLQNAAFRRKANSLAYGKIMSLQAGGSRWEADASSIGMVQPEKGLGVVVAGNLWMVFCSPQSSHFPQILGGSLLNPCWAPGRWSPGSRCRFVMAEAARGGQTTRTCSGFTSSGFQQPLFKNRTTSPHK